MGRLGRIARCLPNYARIAWWGIASPRVLERRPLVVHQCVVLGPEGVLLAVRGELRGWEIPGGGAEPGEAGETAAAREVLEETGIEVAIEGCVAEYHRTGFRPHTARIYRAHPTGGTLQTSFETPRVAWFDPAELPGTMFPWFREAVADANRPASEWPLLRHEYQGVPQIAEGMWIDLRMRWSDDEAT